MSANNHDMHNNVRTFRVVAPIAIGANATVSGKVLDRRDYQSVEFVLSYGAVTTTGSVVTPVVKEGDVTGTMTSVADADLLGTEALAALTATTPRTDDVSKNFTTRIGYKGTKRYVTVDMVKTGTTSVGCMAVTAVMGSPSLRPTTNP